MPPRAKRSTRCHVQTPAPSEEVLDLNVSSSEDDDDPSAAQPVPTNAQPVTPVDIGINDANVREGKNYAPDIRYFFEVTAAEKVCKLCREAKKAKGDAFPADLKYIYSGKTSNTSLCPHLERAHSKLYATLKEKHGWKTQLPGEASQATSAVTAAEDGQIDAFNKQTFHRYLLNFIVANDQSLNIVECKEFRALLRLLRNDLKESMVPHRTKVRELIIQAWRRYFQGLKQELAKAVGRVSFTTDVWSDQNRRPYLAITAHWVAKVDGASLRLKMALIGFHRLRGGHDGKSMAKAVISLLDRAGVTVKAGHFTMDNASANYTMMQELKIMFNEHDIDFDAADRQIMCYGHIVNLSSGRVIEGATKAAATATTDCDEDCSGPPPPDLPDQQSYDDALARDPIALGRNVVRAICASGTRRDAFDEVIVDGNKNKWFLVGQPLTVTKIVPKQLLRDVCTRWDSVYQMLNRLREMRPAIDHLLALPHHKDLAKYQITAQEWFVMQDFEAILSVPRRVQQVMSGESCPLLSGAIPAFELFMTRWEKLQKERPRLKRFIDNGLEWAYKYYKRMDRTRAYVIAMLLNPSIRLSWIRKHWDREFVDKAEKIIRETMNEYRVTTTTEETPLADLVAPCSGDLPVYMTLDAQYGLMEDDLEIGSSATPEQTVEQEYQAYVTASLSPKKVDILKFWEINGTAFPTLFAMAMDYLPIQASAVPCERIFSSSSETDTKRRNRISPLLMEALQMLKFHLKKERLNFTAGWMTPEKQMVDDDPDEDLLDGLLTGDYQDALDRAIRFMNSDEDKTCTDKLDV